jgi:hypothetical protein
MDIRDAIRYIEKKKKKAAEWSTTESIYLKICFCNLDSR